jgi:hypothetical protein
MTCAADLLFGAARRLRARHCPCSPAPTLLIFAHNILATCQHRARRPSLLAESAWHSPCVAVRFEEWLEFMFGMA